MTSINDMTDRQAMGLNVSFNQTKFNQTQALFQEMKACDNDALQEIAESTTAPTRQRYVAGQLLALFGDSRINTLSPAMVDIPGTDAEIGIDEASIEPVLKKYQHVGVIRDWLVKETPKYTAKIADFRIGKYLVTNQEYQQFLLETKFQELPTSWEFGIYPEYKANHPVYTVTEKAAEQYASWLSEKTNRHFRLPTEAEWEYAASGPQHFEFPWGNDYQEDAANTVEENIYASTPVGMFPKGNSPFGLCDMAGNVEEYTANDYAPYAGAPVIEDDLLLTENKYRVCRGGSFSRYSDLARCSRRHGRYSKLIYLIGFRLVEQYC